MDDVRRQASASGDLQMSSTSDLGYADENEPAFEIDLQKIIPAIRRNLWWIVGIVASCLALGAIITMLIVPKYIATASVLIEQEADQIIQSSELQPATSYQDADRFLQTQVDVIKSQSLAERVVESEGLADDPNFYVAMGSTIADEESFAGSAIRQGGLPALQRDQALKLISGSLAVNLPVDSRLAEISFESTDPVLSARIANSFANNLVEANLGRKFESSAYARNYLAQELKDARAKLETSERELNQYSREAGLIRVTGQGLNADQENTLSITNDSLVQANLTASQATAQRVGAEKRWQSIASAPALSIPQVLANPAVQDLIRQRSEAQAKLAEEQARHLAEHPTVLALEAQVSQLNAQIQSVGASIKRSVNLEYKAALDQETSLKSKVNELRNTALDEQDRGVQYNILKREADTNRALYDTLLARANELNATSGATSNNISLVDQAEPPRQPSSPNIVLNIALALLSGMALAGAFVFLREMLDDKIRAPEDVERKLGLQLVGLIPLAQDENVEDSKNDNKSVIGEAYNSLVANLKWTGASGLPRSIAVTSAQASEGKTTTANAIAVDLARLGKNVLLIDADLRRPTLQRYTAAFDQQGLPAVLTQEASFEELVQPSDEANLSFLTGLPIPPNPTILLGGAGFSTLMAKVEEIYDVIIVDCPPMLGLADTPSIATCVESVLIVVDGSQSHRGSVKSALRRLQLVRANVIGAVLTKFDAKLLGAKYDYYSAGYYAYGE